MGELRTMLACQLTSRPRRSLPT